MNDIYSALPVIFLFILVMIAATVTAVTYAGVRQEDGFRYGYIAGYSEAKANLPSRHKYEERK